MATNYCFYPKLSCFGSEISGELKLRGHINSIFLKLVELGLLGCRVPA